MTRPQQLPATWLLRWLLVVITLAGVGHVHSAHCADGPAAAHHAAAAGHHHDGPAAGQHAAATRTTDTAAGHCEVNAPVAEPGVRTGTVTLPAVTACAGSSTPATVVTLTALRTPTVTLTQIGISRI
ncbi:hypothetical protein [Actinoplanes teichomyceticus]|uniref:hypothetical protein n=1 Tax=Actinoplanes teichomyceticus TaxID=1867 RepID=UPI000F09FF71|nr:hypothetical protein [Actinoplanes teichomyceticus]